MQDYYVYILTNWTNKVMYVGMTNNLERRIQEHQSSLIPGFTQRYDLKKLVYYERSPDIEAVIRREKEIKAWRREKKNALVDAMNPHWHDLSQLEQIPPPAG